MEEKAQIQNSTVDRTMQDFYEMVLPIFCLYLVEQFHCKETGVWKFLQWFQKMQDWLNEYPAGFWEIQEDIEKRTGIKIKFERE